MELFAVTRADIDERGPEVQRPAREVIGALGAAVLNQCWICITILRRGLGEYTASKHINGFGIAKSQCRSRCCLCVGSVTILVNRMFQVIASLLISGAITITTCTLLNGFCCSVASIFGCNGVECVRKLREEPSARSQLVPA